MWIRGALLLGSVLCCFGLSAGEELLITCLKSEACVLPCKFNSDGRGVRVMWFKKKAVVSCTRYGNTSFVVGHNSPADKYKGRTDLYADKVLEGNATLVLRDVTPHDEGKYFCITIMQPRTDESAVVSLVVRGPVEDVYMDIGDHGVTCRAEGIYPTPALTWSTDPPTDGKVLRNKTQVRRNRLGFYSVESSLRLINNDSMNQTFICTVVSAVNRRTAHLKEEAWIQALAGSNINVPCSLPYSPLVSFNLTWWFRGTEPILSINVTGAGTQMRFWDEWRFHVYDSRAAVRTLTLRNLTTDHQGAYMCEVTTPEETFLTVSNVTISEDSQLLTFVPLVVLGTLLILSYCTMAYLVVKIRRMERAKNSTDNLQSKSLTVSAESVESHKDGSPEEKCNS